MNQTSQSKSNKIYVELSERSLDLYKAYAQSKAADTRPRSQAIVMKSLDSNYSIDAKPSPGHVTNTSVFRPPEWKQLCAPDYGRFFDLDEQLNVSPFKYLSEPSLNVYLNFLNVGYGGAKQPNERATKLYEEFCR